MSEEPTAPIVVAVDYYVPTGQYASFIADLRTKLADYPHPDNVEGHPVLTEQRRPLEPARWMYCNLSALDHGNLTATTLAVRDDNVYLIGFRAQNGNWYEFGFEGRTVRMIPGSIFLQCDVYYKSLVGGKDKQEVKANLMKLLLGKSSAEEAVSKLAGYVQAGEPDDATKEDLARLIIMVCESARLNSIFSTVNNGWAGESKIKDEQVDYVWNWGKMSQALLGWREYGDRYKWPKKLTNIGVTNAEDALNVVHLLLNKPPLPPRQLLLLEEEDDERDELPLGRPLVEVFSVRADFQLAGTVAVFDGMRGQIIYHCDNRFLRTQQVSEIVLTGPYRAISAHGSCTIQVSDIDIDSTGVAESSRVGGNKLLCWDCYELDGSNPVSDKPLTRAITTAGGPVEVTYAVLSNAVEATVQIKLRLPNAAGTQFYGKVVVRSEAFGDDAASTVLFSHDSNHKVAISTTGDYGTVQLDRSVIAVPLGLPLVVKATFHAADNVVVHGELEFYPELYGEHVKHIVSDELEHGAVEVMVTWSDI